MLIRFLPILMDKTQLKARKIKKFDENNWWFWGRDLYYSHLPRVYVNNKTRLDNPFFAHPCRNYDGSVLAVFIMGMGSINEQDAARVLNQVDWAELGFKVGGRYCFTQRALENIRLPTKLFKQYLEKK